MNCRPTYHEINLDRLVENLNNIQQHIGSNVEMMPTVKADAYGHGAIHCAHTLVEAGVKRLAVAMVDEAVALRKAGIAVPILVLGYTAQEEISTLLNYEVTPTVYQLDFARKLSRVAQRPVPIHLKLDTGMGRLGFRCKDELDPILEILDQKNLVVEGVFSHFATSDESDKSFSLLQLERFLDTVDKLEARGLKHFLRHMANSAAILDLPQSHMDLVRPGILLYGMYPSQDVNKEAVQVRPVKRFVSHVSYVKTIESGDTVSYGRRFTATRPTRVATLPVGYADGYSRLLSNKAEVWIQGRRYPVIGTICMDQTMVDVTQALDPIHVGQEVTLFGDTPTIEEVAAHMGTISYEVTCMTTRRVPKVFVRHGAVQCVAGDLHNSDERDEKLNTRDR